LRKLAEVFAAGVPAGVVAAVVALAASHFLVALFHVVPAAQAQFNGSVFLVSKHLLQPLAHSE